MITQNQVTALSEVAEKTQASIAEVFGEPVSFALLIHEGDGNVQTICNISPEHLAGLLAETLRQMAVGSITPLGKRVLS